MILYNYLPTTTHHPFQSSTTTDLFQPLPESTAHFQHFTAHFRHITNRFHQHHPFSTRHGLFSHHNLPSVSEIHHHRPFSATTTHFQHHRPFSSFNTSPPIFNTSPSDLTTTTRFLLLWCASCYQCRSFSCRICCADVCAIWHIYASSHQAHTGTAHHQYGSSQSQQLERGRQ
jgi:hypothetical protein